jgi:hypothetical protein
MFLCYLLICDLQNGQSPVSGRIFSSLSGHRIRYSTFLDAWIPSDTCFDPRPITLSNFCRRTTAITTMIRFPIGVPAISRAARKSAYRLAALESHGRECSLSRDSSTAVFNRAASLFRAARYRNSASLTAEIRSCDIGTFSGKQARNSRRKGLRSSPRGAPLFPGVQPRTRWWYPAIF